MFDVSTLTLTSPSFSNVGYTLPSKLEGSLSLLFSSDYVFILFFLGYICLKSNLNIEIEIIYTQCYFFHELNYGLKSRVLI